MGRSATLCGGGGGLVTPLNWNAIRADRDQVNKNLASYLKNEACVDGAPENASHKGTYLDELANGYVSILIEELVNLENSHSYGSTISFAVIYTELWRQATMIGAQLSGTGDSKERCIEPPNSDPSASINIQQLRQLNSKWDKWTCSPLESDCFHSFARNLADSYLKALEESRVAAGKRDAIAIKHHMAILGDIFQEMLALHATLMPRKNSRFSEEFA